MILKNVEKRNVPPHIAHGTGNKRGATHKVKSKVRLKVQMKKLSPDE